MKPLMYGYMRVASEAEDDDIERIERGLRSFADAEGFCYAITLFEYQSGSHAAFEELASPRTQTLRSTACRRAVPRAPAPPGRRTNRQQAAVGGDGRAGWGA